VRNFIKETNLDTYEWLCRIYDYVATADPHDQASLRKFAWEMRRGVDADSAELHAQGQELLEWLDALYERRDKPRETPWSFSPHVPMSNLGFRALDESGVSHLGERVPRESARGWEPGSDLFGLLPAPIPYGEFKKRMAEVSATAR